MNDLGRACRITLLDSLLGEAHFDLCRAVIGYGKHLRHWQLRGTIGQTPFSSWADMPWDQIEGLIALGMDEPMGAAAAGKDVSIVSVSPDDLCPELPQITTDFHAVGRLAAEHLLERGYPHFGYIGNDSWRSGQQQEGFEQAIADAGYTCLSLCIKRGDTDHIMSQIRSWLQEVPKPIATMTQMDYYARFTASIASGIGLRIPRDLALVGVNNNRWASILSEKAISSVQLDEQRLGYLAAKTLDTLLQGGTVEHLQLVPPLRVVGRESTDTVLNRDPIVADALQYIRDHAPEGITVEDVLMDAGCSRSTLERRMKASAGYSVHNAILRAQIDIAKQMLTHTEATTEHIAYHCGFTYQARLFEVFQRVTGMTPGEYRRSRRSMPPAPTPDHGSAFNDMQIPAE